MKSIVKVLENKRCYAEKNQRKILLDIISNKTIEDLFFLTGGTALSVFYLHHRISNDLDLFTIEHVDIPEIDFNTVFENAKLKDGIFDDPPTAAYQIEENINIIKNNPKIIPKTLISLNKKNFFSFHRDIIRMIYKRNQFR